MISLKKLGQFSLVGVGTSLLALTLGTSQASAATFLDLTNTVGDDAFVLDVTAGGASDVVNIDALSTGGAGGSGNFSEFLSLNDGNDSDDIELGFNSDISPRPLDTQPGTKSIEIDDLLVDIFGQQFLQFGLDVNENDGAITLDSLQIFLSDSTTFDPNSPGMDTFTQLFDTGNIALGLNSFNGSSNIEYVFLIPIDQTGLDPLIEYVTVSAQLSGASPGGFEEFGQLPNLQFTQIPTPAMLPGLIGMGVAAFRKRKQQNEAAEA